MGTRVSRQGAKNARGAQSLNRKSCGSFATLASLRLTGRDELADLSGVFGGMHEEARDDPGVWLAAVAVRGWQRSCGLLLRHFCQCAPHLPATMIHVPEYLGRRPG